MCQYNLTYDRDTVKRKHKASCAIVEKTGCRPSSCAQACRVPSERTILTVGAPPLPATKCHQGGWQCCGNSALFGPSDSGSWSAWESNPLRTATQSRLFRSTCTYLAAGAAIAKTQSQVQGPQGATRASSCRRKDRPVCSCRPCEEALITLASRSGHVRGLPQALGPADDSCTAWQWK